MNILFYDLETTGRYHWRHGIHQIAGILVRDGKELERFHYKVRPAATAVVDPMAMMVSKTDPRNLLGYPATDVVFRQMLDVLNRHCDYTLREEKIFLAGHNIIAFDNPFFSAFFELNGDGTFHDRFWHNSFDTMQMLGQEVAEDRHLLGSLNLKGSCELLKIPFDNEEYHDALYDAEKAMAIYNSLQRNFK